MPVLHRGYLQLFADYADVKDVLIFGTDLLQRVYYIRKDLRALQPEEQVAVLEGLELFDSVTILSTSALDDIDRGDIELVMPDEDISRAIGDSLKHAESSYFPVFLRWDRSSVENVDVEAQDQEITEEEFHQQVMRDALKRAQTSSDIWRRVGAVLIAKDSTKLGPLANNGEPTNHSPWMEGDPRNIFNRGVGIEMSLFMHAEAGLIAEAARRGVNTSGASIYVSTFPCPACAKLIAHSGIKTCYYKDGYAVLDGADVMKEYGVELIKVNVSDVPTEHPASKIPYTK